MPTDLRTLFSTIDQIGARDRDAIDRFISHCLFKSGVWASPRTSDGIQRIRLLEHTSNTLNLAGWIHHIDQSLHAFWLDLRSTTETALTWRLNFGLKASSPRLERNAIDAHDSPHQIDWRVVLSGMAEVRDGLLVPLEARDANS